MHERAALRPRSPRYRRSPRQVPGSSRESGLGLWGVSALVMQLMIAMMGSAGAEASQVAQAMLAAGPQVMIGIGTNMSQIPTCNSTWYAAQSPEHLGIGAGNRTVRIIDADNSTSRTLGSSCDLVRAPWPVYPWMETSIRPEWPAGPGTPLYSAFGSPTMRTPAVQDTEGHHLSIPALGSPQEPPAMSLNQLIRPSALLPPTRASEPWSTEEWFFQLAQPTNGGAGYSGGLLGANYNMYYGVPEAGEFSRPWSPKPPNKFKDYPGGAVTMFGTQVPWNNAMF